MFKKCIILIAVMSFAVPVLGEILELVYDDGAPSTGFSGGVYDNIIYAVRFTPPSGNWMIKTARYFFVRHSLPAKVRLFDGSGGGPGSNLIPGFNIIPDTSGWFDVDLTGEDIWVSDEFYIGLEMLSLVQLENPSLGADTEGNDRTWNHVGNQWLFNEHTTYFIRAVIDDGEAIEEEAEPHQDVELSCEPVVFESSTLIEYFLPEAGRVHLAVWDATGRGARGLTDEVQSRGIGSIQWDGSDNEGRRLPDGLYFITIDAAGYAQTLKVVIADK